MLLHAFRHLFCLVIFLSFFFFFSIVIFMQIPFIHAMHLQLSQNHSVTVALWVKHINNSLAKLQFSQAPYDICSGKQGMALLTWLLLFERSRWRKCSWTVFRSCWKLGLIWILNSVWIWSKNFCAAVDQRRQDPSGDYTKCCASGGALQPIP